MHRICGAILLACALLFGRTAMAQERFSIFVGSDPTNVERMLKLADLKDDDVVVDLGSGDGRIVLMAAGMNRKLRGWGVDIDEKLVRESNAAAKAQGVADRVAFHHRNVFDADLSDASVIVMWLWPELKRLLRPKILAEAKPGTRVVTAIWDLGSWKADKTDSSGGSIYLWVVPARVDGAWEWDLQVGGKPYRYAALNEQRFQQVEGAVRVGNRRGIFSDMQVNGEDISFKLDMTLPGTGYVRHQYTGKVRGDAIEGTVRVGILEGEQERVSVLPWKARRGNTGTYFAPTGLDAR